MVTISSRRAVGDDKANHFSLGGENRQVDEAVEEQTVSGHSFGERGREGGGSGNVTSGELVGGRREFGTSREEMSGARSKAGVAGGEKRLEANSLAIRKCSAHVVKEDVGKQLDSVRERSDGGRCGGRHNCIRGGRAKYFSCKRRVVMNEESAAVDDFWREDAIHDVSNGEAEDVRSHSLPLIKSVGLKYCAVLLPHLNVANVEGAVEEEEIFQGGEVERVACLGVAAAEDHEGCKAGKRGVRVLDVNPYDSVRGRLEINGEQHVSCGSLRA